MRPLRVTGASVAADLYHPIICNGLRDGFNGSLKWIPKRMHLRFEFAYCPLLFVYREFPQDFTYVQAAWHENHFCFESWNRDEPNPEVKTTYADTMDLSNCLQCKLAEHELTIV